MLKLLLRAVHNILYAVEHLVGDLLYNLDLVGSVVTLGAYPETISARLFAATLPAAPKWQRVVWLLPRKAVDWVAYAVFGISNHTAGAYAKWLALSAPAKPAA